MTQLVDLIIVYCWSFGPVLVIGGISLFWSRHTKIQTLAIILRWGGRILVLASFLVTTFFAVAALSCDGPPRQGLLNCRLVPDETVIFFPNTLATNVQIAAVYLWAMLAGGGLAEAVKFIRRPKP